MVALIVEYFGCSPLEKNGINPQRISTASRSPAVARITRTTGTL
jgi:hypothetical protein